MVERGTKRPIAQVERYTQRVLRMAQQDSFVAKAAACVLAHFVPALEKIHGSNGSQSQPGTTQPMSRVV